ncbi:hypothetical protein HC251_22575 [Iamia sp. SCSIO 61187]|uniref:hypothetical protein n=1 Tax=Iamia sp. SCSIO 61187 TaxID=2722752 RepID=UPI001C62FA2E|nr:hypothetical protein [Iamia sp. SCSIO 61187]QYG94938.1 hypothetical protein HC251_22575 [Iamia sp. SCSIO 61187]
MVAPLPARPAGPSRRRSGRVGPTDARELALWALTALLVVGVALLWWLAVLPA